MSSSIPKTPLRLPNDRPRLAGLLYAYSGRRNDALRVLQELEERATREYVSPMAAGVIRVALGDKERGYALLMNACAVKDSRLLELKVSAVYDRMRADPQFKPLLQCVGLE